MTTPFEDVTRRMLSNLRQDLRDFLHVVCDDQDLDDALREEAIGAVFYGLTPGDVIPDSSNPPLGYVDDAIALRIVLAEIEAKAPAAFERYRDRLPDLCDTLHEDLDSARAFLGDVYEPFVERVRQAKDLAYKGKTVRDAFEDPAFLDEEITVLSVKLAFKDEAVAGAARKVSTLLPQFRQKLTKR
ncbi:MAG: DUF1232 domain-containing protein [Myxococcales bacterium]|nr:DUF1232 domain-containing protein [Myxococcales bacterium]